MFYTVVWLVLFGSMMFFGLDVYNYSFMEMFDYEIPLNGWFYALYWITFVISIDTVRKLAGVKE